ncbi:50S ribosomal protein L29 [Larkinella soli]|uniref:50S ribosomal protein L29 n=1 Tax=Larkinella soli TaxID=1770527 RepID=UPI000FFBC717|nr:50S ribosomal protein L29 [Larkinella soli]
MKKNEIKSLTVEQLKEQIAVEKDRLQKLKFAHAISPVENPMRIRTSRKLIAQLLTELTIKEKPGQA